MILKNGVRAIFPKTLINQFGIEVYPSVVVNGKNLKVLVMRIRAFKATLIADGIGKGEVMKSKILNWIGFIGSAITVALCPIFILR